VRRERRLPEPGLSEQAFLNELKACGLPVGDYNLPDWEETNEGLATVLESLFGVTPPTALLIDEPDLYVAVQHILGTHGIWAPQQVSLICSETHALFKWSTPTISHMRWDEERVVPRITRWASALSRGRRDVTQTLLPNEFVPGDSIGPAPKQVSRWPQR
jgi:DNA-binding LacI/PurR family transcriptional regulator